MREEIRTISKLSFLFLSQITRTCTVSCKKKQEDEGKFTQEMGVDVFFFPSADCEFINFK